MGAYHNEILTVLPSAARTTAQSSQDFENFHNRGVKVVVDITAVTGSPILTVKIQGKDHTSGKYYDILTSAALTAQGTTVLTVYPGVTPVTNVTIDNVIPRFWRVSVTVGNSDSATYSIGACTIR
ncbi:hypothetical protein [Paenibacillus contaminans]|uniref:Uncharacterized protein n=1 Tax=Paenibacillus contaminans TaxID=450362 RepID=A0A329MQL7_9BACL|nr:hypothetical protein [Paenibacillus contaminans]RAV22205.1 hypothetical protein DQG23_04435 [Paenibacillus contaminans]